MGRAALVAAGAVLIVAGGAALGFALTRKAQGGMTPRQTEAMGAAMTKLDTEINAARAQLRGTAAALSKLVAVRGAVATDAQTAHDQADKGELKFSPDPGQVIELGQVIGGKAMTLLVQPDGAKLMSRNGMPGSYANLAGSQLGIMEIVEVVPSSDAVRDGKKITGYVAVSRTLDLAPMIGDLVAAGIHGRLENTAIEGVQTLAIGTPEEGAATEARPLPSQRGLQIVANVPPATAAVPKPILAGGAGAAVFGVLLVVMGMMKRAAPGGAPQRNFNSLETVPSGPQAFVNAPTQLSGSHATGTPSPVDGTGSTINPANLGPGAMIGRWEVIRRLGSGGMADVYLAHSRGEAGFQKLVAIKVMHSHLARNQRAVDHFLDEAKLAAQISHPNVVAIQDLGKIGNDYVIVMDYVEGVDLERLLASAREGGRLVPVEVGLGILCRICDGLHAAHRATGSDGTPLGIIHRDVKSANVLVSRQGGVKVVDFGIAKAAKQGHLTVAGETKGTPSMMAPEQRVGEQVDVRADVYSVSAVGFELLTGHAVNLDLAALAHLGIDNWPHLPLPSSLRPNLPPELDGLLLNAMAYERERRPADCAAFEAMFERVMKANALTCSDKDIARWVESELVQLVPPFEGVTATTNRAAT